MQVCEEEGCCGTLNKAGHRLCYRHWKMERDGKLESMPDRGWRGAGSGGSQNEHTTGGTDTDDDGDGVLLSSTKLGRHFGISAQRMNLVLAELGWIEKYVKGWTPTERGNQLGAQVREIRRSGVPYVVWPASILDNSVLVGSVRDVTGHAPSAGAAEGDSEAPAESGTELSGFREKFPAKFRATDGHMVRSRAEMLIDNWLYMQGIVHAFERKLPIEEEVYCDFYLPENSGGNCSLCASLRASIDRRFWVRITAVFDGDCGNVRSPFSLLPARANSRALVPGFLQSVNRTQAGPSVVTVHDR